MGHIVLTPPDGVESGGRIKPLRDCTLSELLAYAEELESGVWEAYQSIKLSDLDGAGDVSIEVTVKDKKGQSIALDSWHQQAVLLPERQEAVPLESPDSREEPDSSSAADESEEPTVAPAAEPKAVPAEPGATDEEPLAGEVAPEAEAPPEPEAPIADEAAEPQVRVSQTEPVYAEREAIDDPHAFPTPTIAPSKARVRILGRRLPPGHATWAAVDVLIDESALRSAQAHALSSPNREVAGVLVGPQPEKQPDGRYIVHIIDTIIAKHTVMQGASVTYTPESWRYLNDRLNERYPDETAVMVGWYHTHPGFGIFLSGMDQFIHQNFFTQVWHTAMVLDPVARKSGFFCWDRSQTRVDRLDFAWPKWASGTW